MYGSKVLAKCNLDTTFSSMVGMKSGQRRGGVIRFATSTKRFGGETFFFNPQKGTPPDTPDASVNICVPSDVCAKKLFQ